MTIKETELYDRNNYYGGDGKASRLTPCLNGLLYFLDWFKAWRFSRISGLHSKSSLPAGAPLRVLDVGAGDGKFLYFMKKFGLDPQGTTASTISQLAAKEKYGIDLHFSKEIPESIQSCRFDGITYWHVFEHLEQPEAHVAIWAKILADNGVIMIEVPNVDSIGAKLSFKAWLGGDLVHHINHMPERAIVELFKKHGFVVTRSEGFSLKFTYPYLWSALLGKIFGEKEYYFDSVFGALKDPLATMKKNPIMAINTLGSIFYLAPVILVLAMIGLLTGRGEVTRLYARRLT
jgi:SAM-dependent methyltransferase